ncbi:MAG: hypothetical protein WKG00_09785 [Polyangiaceae bacterium]
MRLGILGPAQGDLPALARGAHYLLDEARVERVVYLAADDALDRVVASWASEIVGDTQGSGGLLARAAARCAAADPATIDEFVDMERARLRLQVMSSLPSDRRSIEILDGRVVLFVWDKSTLDEDDIAAASILCFGKSNEAMIKKVGTRIFVAPGPVGGKDGGCAVLDDGDGGVRISILTHDGQVTAKGSVGAPITGAKMRVQGGG